MNGVRYFAREPRFVRLSSFQVENENVSRRHHDVRLVILSRDVLFPAGFIPVEKRLLHYCGRHLNLKSPLVQRPESTGVNPVGLLLEGLVPEIGTARWFDRCMHQANTIGGEEKVPADRATSIDVPVRKLMDRLARSCLSPGTSRILKTAGFVERSGRSAVFADFRGRKGFSNRQSLTKSRSSRADEKTQIVQNQVQNGENVVTLRPQECSGSITEIEDCCEPARLELPMLTVRQFVKAFGFLLACAVVAGTSETAHGQSFGTGSSGSGSSTSSSSSSTRSTTSSTSSGSTGSSNSSGIGLTTNTPIDRSATSSNTNQASDTGFVGASSSQNFVGGTRQANQTQGQNRQFQAFQANQNNQSSQSQQSGTPRSVRTTLRMAFSFPAATAAQQTGSLAPANSLTLSRFEFDRPELSGINVNMTNTGEVILTGNVATTEASRLAANLVRLQPGVRKVNNQLAVTQ